MAYDQSVRTAVASDCDRGEPRRLGGRLHHEPEVNRRDNRWSVPINRFIPAAALLLALAMPAAVSAADTMNSTTAVTAGPVLGGAWEISAIETSGVTIQISGKLAIGTDLSASVGCNTLSAPVTSFDGTHLVIGSIATTLIGCPSEQARAEQMLASVLGAGALTFDGRSLTSNAGRIDFVGNQPAQPIATPQPVPSGPAVDPVTCARLLGPAWSLSSAPVPAGAAGAAAGSAAGGFSGSGSGPVAVSTSAVGFRPTRYRARSRPGARWPSSHPSPGPTEPAGTVPVASPQPNIPVTPVPLPVEVTSPAPIASANVQPAPGGSASLVELCDDLLSQLRGGTLAFPPAGAAGGAVPGVATTDKQAFGANSPGGDNAVLAVLAVLLVALVAGAIAGRRMWSRRRGTPPPAASA